MGAEIKKYIANCPRKTHTVITERLHKVYTSKFYWGLGLERGSGGGLISRLQIVLLHLHNLIINLILNYHFIMH
jgi:hypothetical protein